MTQIVAKMKNVNTAMKENNHCFAFKMIPQLISYSGSKPLVDPAGLSNGGGASLASEYRPSTGTTIVFVRSIST